MLLFFRLQSAICNLKFKFELHVSFSSQRLQSPSVILVLGPARSLGDVFQFSASKFFNDFLRVLASESIGKRAGITPQGTVTFPISLIVVEGDRGDFFPVNIFPDV